MRVHEFVTITALSIGLSALSVGGAGAEPGHGLAQSFGHSKALEKNPNVTVTPQGGGVFDFETQAGNSQNGVTGTFDSNTGTATGTVTLGNGSITRDFDVQIGD